MSKPASKSPRAEDARLTEIGIDSLMAVELRGALAETFGAELPPLSIGETTTVSDMAGTILKALGIGETAGPSNLVEELAVRYEDQGPDAKSEGEAKSEGDAKQGAETAAEGGA